MICSGSVHGRTQANIVGKGRGLSTLISVIRMDAEPIGATVAENLGRAAVLSCGLSATSAEVFNVRVSCSWISAALSSVL